MTQRKHLNRPARILLGVLSILLAASALLPAEPPPEAVSAFNRYVAQVETRLALQHRSTEGFLAGTPADQTRIRQGGLTVEQVPAGVTPQGAMLHHWRGTAFAPGATATDFERLLRDINAYPRHFSPQVIQAKILKQDGNNVRAVMRVRQRHVITVVLDTTYDIAFGRLDPQHGFVTSRSTKIAEIDAPGTGEDHGFLWRLNTYWSFEERDGGLYMQIESVSLTRSIPAGLAWAVLPFIESVPRESLEFTLRSASNALRK